MSLPKWVEENRGDLYHSEYEIECEDHLLACKLIEALSIACEALEHFKKEPPCFMPKQHAEEAMRRIEEMGK